MFVISSASLGFLGWAQRDRGVLVLRRVVSARVHLLGAASRCVRASTTPLSPAAARPGAPEVPSDRAAGGGDRDLQVRLGGGVSRRVCSPDLLTSRLSSHSALFSQTRYSPWREKMKRSMFGYDILLFFYSFCVFCFFVLTLWRSQPFQRLLPTSVLWGCPGASQGPSGARVEPQAAHIARTARGLLA